MTIVKLSEVMGPAFIEPHRAIKNNVRQQVVAKGGRGGLKSSWASIEGVLAIIRHPKIHGVVLRKVANTLANSVFAQYQWAVDMLGLSDKWKITKSPMYMTYKPTGQRIMFFGTDDPNKLKSIKTPFGYIGFLHFEELDQFDGDAEIRKVEQSVMRGGDVAIEIKTFNPPRTALNWANKYCLMDKPGQLIHTSTYLDTPSHWLGERFLEDANHLMEIDRPAYEHEYLGIANGTGGAVFDKLKIERIPDSMIEKFDRIYQGIDWGYTVDPAAFVRLHYNQGRNIIYIMDEIYERGLQNDDFARKIKEKRYHKDPTCADSEEPKSIDDVRRRGVAAYGAKKGPDSVRYTMKWLQGKTIVIDPRRTPNAFREFTEYEYERTRDGEFISRFPDKNNHIIDACRYAIENLAISSKTSA